MPGLALISFALAQAAPGSALAEAIGFCVTRATTAEAVDARSPQLPELVRNFISVPPRFSDADLRLVRFSGSNGATAWAAADDDTSCEVMLTGSPDHLAERDAAIGLLQGDAETEAQVGTAMFWQQRILVKRDGKAALISMRGTGAANTQRDEIQLDVSITTMTGRID